jgi:hypothetical protein
MEAKTPEASARRENFLASLNHKQPSKIPIDFNGTGVTGIHVTCVAQLREYYGLEKHPLRVFEPCQMLGHLDDDLLDAMGIDVVGVIPRKTFFGFPNVGWKPWRLNGLEVMVSTAFNTTVDANGDILMYPEGDTSVPPSARMPRGGHFFDAIVRQKPIVEEALDPEDNLEEYGPISQEDLQHFAVTAAAARASGRGVAAGFGGTAFGDIALIPAPFLKDPKGIRDITEWYVSTKSRRDYVHRVFQRQCEIALSNLEKIYGVVGDNVDAVLVCGTDFGTQTSSFCSVSTFRELYFPYYKQVNDWIHRHTGWKTMKHSCGAIVPFMEPFIEAGFDIITPVQCSALGMDPATLKANYGDRIVFWGGGADTQHLLPFGTPEQVRDQVLRRCEIFSKNGGFVFNSVHNIQAGTPVANIVAMIDAVGEFNGQVHA